VNTVALGSVARIFNGNSISQTEKDKHFRGAQGLPYIGTAEIGFDTVINYDSGVSIPQEHQSDFKLANAGTPLVCAEGGSAGRKVGFLTKTAFFGNKLFAIEPSKNWDGKFLFYFCLSSDFRNQFLNMTTGLIGGVSIKKFKELRVPSIALEEQRQIVAVLDKGFAAIATATANAQKNQSNARALFESYLNEKLADFAKSPNLCRLADLCTKDRIITYGVIKLGDETPNGVPCLRTSNVRWLRIDKTGMKRIEPNLSRQYSRTILEGGEVLVNVRGTLGGVAVATAEMTGWNVSREVAVVPVDIKCISSAFLAYWIGRKESQDWLAGVQKGAAYSGINIADLRELMVNVPPMPEQNAIVDRISRFHDKCKELERSSITKLAALTELKQSLLKKAFAGELSAAVAGVVLPAANDNFATAQGTANMIAFAYWLHKKQNRDKSYKRIKAQKCLHNVESIAGIDLGRQPMKHRNGPHDEAHMSRAEDWAREQGFFEFVESTSGPGKDFKKLANYDVLWTEAVTATKPVAAALERAIDPLIPMDMEKAELFATVHAAWNNLIRNGATINDDAIVKEARDDWHADKLKIPEHKFRDTIRTIKAKGMEPDGSAKYVGGQASLF
jgi:type I restriction enzyme, S subunit